MSDDIEKFFDDTAMKSAISLGMSNPAWLSEFAAKTAIKADRLEKDNERLKYENKKLREALKAVCSGVISERTQISAAVIEGSALIAARAAMGESDG